MSSSDSLHDDEKVPVAIDFHDIPLTAIISQDENNLNDFKYKPIYMDVLSRLFYGVTQKRPEIISYLEKYESEWGAIRPIKVNCEGATTNGKPFCCDGNMKSRTFKIAYIHQLSSFDCHINFTTWLPGNIPWYLIKKEQNFTIAKTKPPILLVYMGGKDQTLVDCLSVVDVILFKALVSLVNNVVVGIVARNRNFSQPISIGYPFDILLLDPPGCGYGSGSTPVNPDSCIGYAVGAIYNAINNMRKSYCCDDSIQVFMVGFSLGSSIVLAAANELAQDKCICIQHLYLIAPFTNTNDVVQRVLYKPFTSFLRPFVDVFIGEATAWDNEKEMKRFALLDKLPSITITTGDTDPICPTQMGRKLYDIGVSQNMDIQHVEHKGSHVNTVSKSIPHITELLLNGGHR